MQAVYITMSVGGHHGHLCGGEAGAKKLVVAHAHLPSMIRKGEKW